MDKLIKIQDRYEVRDMLGEGGFGKVYRAFDTELQRPVAIKVLSTKWISDDAQYEVYQERFRREAKVTAQIKHPNVVTIYDVGELETGQLYIVMEYMGGLTLSETLAREKFLAPKRAIPHVIGILEGLGLGHEKGIVHKDLKPGNLIVTRDATQGEMIRVFDFGIARVLHDRKLTATGRIVGTPRYLAPEYIEEMRVTPALDVYQMGLILVEMLAGSPCIPNTLDHITSCERHLSGTLDRPTFLLEGPLGAVLDRALARDEKSRFQNAKAFADALKTLDLDSLQDVAPKLRVNTGGIDATELEFVVRDSDLAASPVARSHEVYESTDSTKLAFTTGEEVDKTRQDTDSGPGVQHDLFAPEATALTPGDAKFPWVGVILAGVVLGVALFFVL